jgi:hypothetical protein
MALHKILSPVRTAKGTHQVGEQVDFSAADAVELLALGAIEPCAETSVVKLDSAELHLAIANAISTLDRADATLWTASGLPKLPAVSAAAGFPVSQTDRDVVWASLQAAAE